MRNRGVIANLIVLIGSAMLMVACRDHQQSLLPTEPRSVEDTFGTVTWCWSRPQVLWSWSRPASAGSVVVFATGDGKLVARDTGTAALLWSVTPTNLSSAQRVEGNNLVVRSGVVVAAISRNVVGVDLATGVQLWSYGAPPDTLDFVSPTKPGAVSLVNMASDDSTVFVPAWGASVSAVDIKTGVARWVWRQAPGTQYRAGAQGVALSGDTVFATVWHWVGAINNSTEGWVVAIDRRDGHELGRAVIPPFSFGNVFSGSPVVWNDLVIVAHSSGVIAMRRDNYAVAWKHAPPTLASGGTSGTIGLTMAGDTVFTDIGRENNSSDRDAIVGLNAADGTEVWNAPVMSLATSDVLVTAKRVYVVEYGLLNIIDRATRKYIARVNPPPPPPPDGILFSTAPLAVGKKVFLGGNRMSMCLQEP